VGVVGSLNNEKKRENDKKKAMSDMLKYHATLGALAVQLHDHCMHNEKRST